MLEINKIKKTYHAKGIDYPVLKGITATIPDGAFVAVMGASGSGKTTLLNSMSGFITVDSGNVFLDGQDILTEHENTLAEIRQHKLGFVFQDFMLLNGLTIRENIFLPQIISGKPSKSMEDNTNSLLSLFGIYEIADKYPAEVSGGQKQRASIARALSNHPSIILADEPTGNLDSKSSAGVIEAFLSAKEKMGATIFMVTHDAFAASYADKVILDPFSGEADQGYHMLDMYQDILGNDGADIIDITNFSADELASSFILMNKSGHFY